MPTHELQTPPATPHPLYAAANLIVEISNRNAQMAERVHPLLGSETYFVGEVHGGDFYNRYPTSCRIVGTRRWWPSRSLDVVEREFRALVDDVATRTGCDVALDLRLVRDGYEIDPEHELVRQLQDAYHEVTGAELRPVGVKVVADGALFAAAGIPTVYHGPRGSGAHADEEWMPVGELVRAANVYVALLRRLLR
jgi:acetylornithine deacetylase